MSDELTTHQSAMEMALALADLINEDHDTELNHLDVLDYLAILGLGLTEDENSSQRYLSALGVKL